MASVFSKPGAIPGIGLFLLFAGIWTSDSALIGLAHPPGGYLPVRVFSLAAYAALFVALRVEERRELRGNRRGAMRFERWIALGCGLFALGTAGVLALRGQNADATVLAPLALTKCIGPLLSIPLLASFSTLARRTATTVSTISLACAFAVEPTAQTLVAAVGWGPEALLAMGAALLGGAGWACSRATTGLAAARCPFREAPTRPASPENRTAIAAENGPTTRERDESVSATSRSRKPPSEGLLTKSTLIGIAGTVMLLGFMRTEGFPGADMGVAPALVVLVAGLFATGRFAALEIHELFRAAVVCAAAGFLLDPVLSPIAPDAEQLLAGVGTTLFEIVVWTTSATIVGSCGNRLRAAAATRLAAVSGHLLGSVVATAATAVGDAIPQAEEAASLALVFAYVVGLLYLSGDETLRSVLSTRNAVRRSAGHNKRADRKVALGGTSEPAHTPAPADPAPDRDLAPGSAAPADLAPADLLYWKHPCALVAEDCGLTPRETEVLEQLAQGRDLAFMEEHFTISRNTIIRE